MSKDFNFDVDGNLTLKELIDNSHPELPTLKTKLSELVGYKGLVPNEYAPIIQSIITEYN